MTRPFNPIHKQHIAYEVKYGEKTQTAKGSTRPTKLNYFKVIYRRRGDALNWDKVEGVHKILGDEPTSIPIRLMSDNPLENLSMYRGLFSPKHGGKLMCGSVYGSGYAMRMMAMDELTLGDDGIYSDGKFRSPLEFTESPYKYNCTEDCPFWKTEDPLKQCKMRSKLLFTIDVPDFYDFCLLRVNGIYAQLSLSSSLRTIKAISHGILANIPLNMKIHFEKSKDKIGGYYQDLPHITLELRHSLQEHENFILEELKRRDEIRKIIGANTVYKEDALEGIWSPSDISSEELDDSPWVIVEERDSVINSRKALDVDESGPIGEPVE